MSDIKIIWNPDKGDVLSRFARALSNGTGWEIVRSPDKKAAINYWLLYISIAQSPDGVKGLNKTAALFSHYEEEIPQKAEWWNIAAPLVDIRTTWAEQYLAMLEPYGASYLVTPPIDNQFFKRARKPVIGVSGYVHPGHRKGEHLLKRLVAEHSGDYEIIASGKGWPVPPANIRERKWNEMPAFYDSLDIYLVTSLTEGIPMPPLEALAMGKRVVVPEGVGLLSELRGMEGVFFYERGNYASMLVALEWAAKKPENAIKEFTEDAWCESHRIAFGLDAGAEIKSNGEFIKFDPPLIIPKESIKSAVERYKELNGQPFNLPPIDYSLWESPKIPKSGAIVVAYGKPARECAQLLINSWKAFMPQYPIALVSDSPLLPLKDNDEFEDITIIHPDTDIGARSVKTKLYDLAPAEWENVLYLDADTEIVADVSVLFQWLQDGFDFLICTNPKLYSSIAKGRRPDNAEELAATIEEVGTGDFCQMNGGVFAFRRGEKAAALMQSWHEEWQRWGARDQLALMRALHKNPLRWRLLGNEWNTVVRFCPPEMTAGILHYAIKARRWTGIIQGRLDSQEAWSRIEE